MNTLGKIGKKPAAIAIAPMPSTTPKVSSYSLLPMRSQNKDTQFHRLHKKNGRPFRDGRGRWALGVNSVTLYFYLLSA